MPSTESLNVIALISGGKDSLYSILHCIRNGHRVVALANLHPPVSSGTGAEDGGDVEGRSVSQVEEQQEDIDSFMYQTIGHNVIPLYESVLRIPLYRGSIIGGAVDTSRVYRDSHTSTTSTTTYDDGNSDNGSGRNKSEEQDETESLIPLLTRIKHDIPHANAISAGAILSTYQRTRIENVAGRLGLVPLAFLWMYPHLPSSSAFLSESDSSRGVGGGEEGSLLDDMAAVGCDARIIKVASGGLDADILWENVSSSDGSVRRRIEKSMKRFVDAEDLKGAVLGEGGEYETLALDGPEFLWKKRIVVEESDRRVCSAGGGVSFVRILRARCVEKEEKENEYGDGDGAEVKKLLPENVRRPAQFERRFQQALDQLQEQDFIERNVNELHAPPVNDANSTTIDIHQSTAANLYTISNITAPEAGSTADAQMHGISTKLQKLLNTFTISSSRKISTSDIVFTTVLLRSMQDFGPMNAIYVSLFTRPNPPARVTVACGDNLPTGVQVMISVVVDLGDRNRRHGLHVQSRSYWAPANIGPYSQAITVPYLNKPEEDRSDTSRNNNSGGLVCIAGQIPLDPPSMEIPGGIEKMEEHWFQNFSLHATLSLQHLWRIGLATQVDWWIGAIVFLARDPQRGHQKAQIANKLWKALHTRDEEAAEAATAEDLDVWDIKHGLQQDPRLSQGARPLPNLEMLVDDNGSPPLCFVVEVEDLPRNSDIEWQALGTTGMSVSSPVIVPSTYQGIRLWCTQLNNRDGLFYAIEVEAETSLKNLNDEIDSILSDTVNQQHHAVHCTIYTSHGLSVQHWRGQVVPCHTVWGSEGKAIAAVITVQIVCNS